jgi:hypothetical protein
MTTEAQREQQERREVLLQDADLRRRQEREQKAKGSTLHQFAIADAEIDRGRFNATERSTAIGSTPLPQYPELSLASPRHHDPVPNEAPLGYSHFHSGSPAALRLRSANTSPSRRIT